MPSILVVDDERQIRVMLKKLFEKEGFKVDVASNGKEGLDKYRESQADVIITDIVMPEKEGIELIHTLRKEYPDVKIIAISGGQRIGPEGYLKMAEKLGADRVFEKPVPRVSLLSAVYDLLKKAEC